MSAMEIEQPQHENILARLANIDPKKMTDDSVKELENQILAYASLLTEQGNSHELAQLIRYIRPFLANISKAKAAKIVQTLVEKFLEIKVPSGIEIDLCKECIEWAKEEKRIFLRQSLEAKLFGVYYEKKQFDEALALCAPLLKELKKMDDKNLLVEVQLIESKIYHALGNIPKARGALTAARTTANGIYCAPKMQAALDLQSGIVHASEEKDFHTAYSYFYEAFEGYETCATANPTNDFFQQRVMQSLKYMLLAKIMLNNPEEAESLIINKLALKYSGKDLEALQAIALASKNRSLADFEKARNTYSNELMGDTVIKMLCDNLYDKLLEQNLLCIVEPYSRVQIKHVAKTIELPFDLVEKKLSQMILDQKLKGIIDQGEGGILIVFDESAPDRTFESVLNIIDNMSKVVDTLYTKSKTIN